MDIIDELDVIEDKELEKTPFLKKAIRNEVKKLEEETMLLNTLLNQIHNNEQFDNAIDYKVGLIYEGDDIEAIKKGLTMIYKNNFISNSAPRTPHVILSTEQSSGWEFTGAGAPVPRNPSAPTEHLSYEGRTPPPR